VTAATRERDGVPLGLLLASLDGFLRPLGQVEEATPVHDIVIFDSSDSITPGSVVLAVGAVGDEADAGTVLRIALERGAAAVVFRVDPSAADRLAQRAPTSGLALLALAPEFRWEQAHILLRAAFASGGAPRAIVAGLPVGDLFAFADAVADAVGGPTLIADPDWHVLAYSNLEYEVDEARSSTILSRALTADSRRRMAEVGLMGALRSSDEVVRWTDRVEDASVQRLTAPVRAGDELVGVLTVAEASIPLDATAELELARAAQLAVVHLLGHRTADEIRRQTRGAFLREVLEGWAPSRPPASVMRTAGPLTALVFELATDLPQPPRHRRERVLGLVSLSCESHHREAVCAAIDEQIWCLVPTLGADQHRTTSSLAVKIVERVEAATATRLRAGIGTTVTSIVDVPRSRRAAEQALAVLERSPRATRVVHIDDVRAHAGLLQVIDWASRNEELSVGKLEKLHAHDRRRRTSYVETLRAYLDAWGDIPTTAGKLSIHRNTLRHRLARLVEISGLDLSDPDERLMTELQLRIPLNDHR
jgi:hypothetical protein